MDQDDATVVDDAENDDYEPEYEVEEVTVLADLRLKVWSVVPPPLEYMSALHSKQQEISGRQVWTGSLALAQVLVQQQPQAAADLRNRRVLELGSGTGILGMAIALRFQPQQLVVTDGDAVALKLLRDNMVVNDLDMPVELLWWGKDDVEAFRERHSDSFDCIVAGDVLYKADLPALFFESVTSLLKPEGVLWLCHVPRSTVTQEIVIEAARKAKIRLDKVDFDVTHVVGCPMEDLGRACVYRGTRLP